MIDLNIFTNCTKFNSDTCYLISKTLDSWCKIFGKNNINEIHIYIHSEPNKEKYNVYYNAVNDYFSKFGKPYIIQKTNGLADGYVQSTHDSKTEYIFQLEHDWIFCDTITHSLKDILDAIKSKNIEYFKFNKRINGDRPKHKEDMVEENINDIPFCKITKGYRSNNPHIIHRETYLNKWNKKIIEWPKRHGADGIEQMFRSLRAGGYVYGRYRHQPSIKHFNGKVNREGN
jgi:hypothetical protein